MTPSSPKGTNASMWARAEGEPPPSFSRNWPRDKEPGSAFRATPRGRGRGRGRGSGRGGRGQQPATTGRDDGASHADPGAARVATRDGSSSAPPSTSSKTPTTLELPKGNIPPSPSSPLKPKFTSRRSSQASGRKALSLMVELSPAPNDKASGMPPPSPLRPSPLRRRSAQPNRTTSGAASRGAPSEDETRPRQSLLSPLVLSKDTPPHLSVATAPPTTHAFDIRTDIDTLVERVRAIAMENHRPSTPGSHIDWAGDDDDSLPDLDDWGVMSTQSTQSTQGTDHVDGTNDIDILSPITEKPILEVVAAVKDQKLASPLQPRAPEGKIEITSTSTLAPPKKSRDGERSRARGKGKSKDKNTQDTSDAPRNNAVSPIQSANVTHNPESDAKSNHQAATHSPQINGRRNERNLRTPNTSSFRLGPGSSASSFTESVMADLVSLEPRSAPATSLPHHPSLPPKPVTSALHTAAGFKRPTSPALFPPNLSAPGSWGSSPQVASPPPGKKTSLPAVDVVDHAPDKLTAADEGPIMTPLLEANSLLATATESGDGKPEASPQPMKSALLDNRSPITSSEGSPNSGVIHSQSMIDLVHPTHNRSQTFGNPSDATFPRSSSVQRRGRDRSSFYTHDRTHSSPQTGPGTATARARAPHATRPIISFDAIQRISKSLGKESLPPSKRDVVPVMTTSGG